MSTPLKFKCPRCAVRWRWPEWMEKNPQEDNEPRPCPSCEAREQATGRRGAK